MFEDERIEIIERLIPIWKQIQAPSGTKLRWYIQVTDLSQENEKRLKPLIPKHSGMVRCSNFNEVAPRYIDNKSNWSWRLGLLREMVRENAIEESDYLFWIDSDNSFESDALTKLFDTMTFSCGPLRPRIVTGAYCSKFGCGIANWWGKSEKKTVAPLMPNKLNVVGYNGFGCALIDTECAQTINWKGHADYCLNHLEETKQTKYVGEDIYYCRQAESEYGMMTVIDTYVLVKHWTTPHSYWEFYDDGGVYLKTRFVEENE